MAEIQWGLLQNGQNGFQNALQMGLQAGQAFSGMMQAREERRDRNALADVLMRGQQGQGGQQPTMGAPMGGGGLVATPEQQAQQASLEQQFPNAPAYGQEAQGMDPSMRRLAERDPQTFMRIQAQQREQEQARQQQEQSQNGTVRQLLRQAGSSPEGWQQAMGAAQQMGIDTRRFPQQFDPQWAQQQMLIFDALSDPQTATAVVRDVEAMGLDPQSEEGMAAVQELTLYKYAKPTTDEQGRPSLSMPTITMPGGGQQSQAAPQQPAPEWGSGSTFTFDQFRANVAAMGPEQALANMERSGVAVQIADDTQYDSLPSGAMFRAPDGSMRRKP